MLLLKLLLALAGVGGLAAAAARLALDLRGRAAAEPGGAAVLRWRLAAGLALVGGVALALSLALVVVPAGHAAVRVSQLVGIRPGILQPGVHLIWPLVEGLAVYDLRDRVMTTGDPSRKTDPLAAQSKEGLPVGLAVTVRYRLDPARLPAIHATLPPEIDADVVAPLVASAFREVLPQYLVKEVFAEKREDVRSRAAVAIVEKLAADGVLVREVLLRDVVLPPEYAQGLEALLLKAQESDRLVYELEIKEKQVRQAELEAEADKRREVKAAEAQAQVRVLQAKAEADAMQHTLPLKQKQIEQTRLEAEARMASTLKDAEAAAQAQVIKGKAEAERDRIMSDAEANRIRVTSAAELERLRIEAGLLKENPLLIQKIVAERLSDKMQIMMVPIDGRNFFANEVFRSVMPALPADEPAAAKGAVRTASRK
jgi:regulator of protease activity HflC (stomatin/prohibitin superfamily)